MSCDRPLPLLSHPDRAGLEVGLPLFLEPIAAAFCQPALVDLCVRAEFQFHTAPSFADEYLWKLWWAGADLPRTLRFNSDREVLAHSGKLASPIMRLYGRQPGLGGWLNLNIFQHPRARARARTAPETRPPDTGALAYRATKPRARDIGQGRIKSASSDLAIGAASAPIPASSRSFPPNRCRA